MKIETIDEQKRRDVMRGILRTECPDWASIDKLVEAGDGRNIWPDGLLETAETYAKKRYIRDLLSQLKDTGNDGDEVVSLTTIDPETGKSGRGYKQLTLFAADDFVQVIAERFGRLDHFGGEILRFAKLAIAKFPELQGKLDGIDWDNDGTQPRIHRTY